MGCFTHRAGKNTRGRGHGRAWALADRRRERNLACMAEDAPSEASSHGPEPEAATRHSSRLWRQVLDALPAGVAVMDAAGNILLVNAASSRIWGGLIRSAAERYPRSHAFAHGSGEPLPTEAWASVRALTLGETSVNELLDIETYDGRRRT